LEICVAAPIPFKYRAFLSYSHRDKAWGKWLHSALEGYRIDKDLPGRETPAGPVPKTLRPIFRDREDFSAGHSLTDQTLAALEASRFLIVLCSPNAVRSQYVNEEIRRFKLLGRAERVIPVIVDGEPGDPVRECFPPALRVKLGPDGRSTDEHEEPIAADARPQGDGKEIAKQKVVAGLLGVGLDEIVRRAERARKRRNRFWGALAGVFLVLAVAATGSAVYAWQQLKTNEAFLNAALERATEIVDEAVVQAEKYHVPRAATLTLLGKAEGLFDDMARYGRPTPELRYRKAWMLIQFARNYEILGDSDKQFAGANEAHGLLSGLAAEKPDDLKYQGGLPAVLVEVGDVLVAQGNLTGALTSFRDSLAIAERLAKSDPHEAVWRRDLSISYDRIGDVLVAQGNLSDALTSFRHGLAIAEWLAKSDPDSATWQRDLSVSYNSIGRVLVAQGNLSGALASFRDSLAIVERLAKADPNNARWQYGVGISSERIGDVLMAQGDLAGALTLYRAKQDIIGRLAKSDPDNAGWQRDLSLSYDKVGDVLVEQGNLPAALTLFRDSLAIAERLAWADPNNAKRQRDLTVSYDRVGDVLMAQGNLSGALRLYRDSLAIAERLARADPHNADWQRDLTVSYDRVGHVLMEQRNPAAALTSFRDSLAIRARLAKADPNNAEWQSGLSVSYEKIGDMLVVQGNLPAALTSFRDSLAIRERLTKADPDNAGWQRDLSVSYDRVGDVLMAQGNLTEALALFRNGLAIGAALVAKDASNAEWREDLRYTISRIGDLAYSLVLAGDFATALAAADQVIALASEQSWIDGNRAHALMLLSRVDEARALYLRYRGKQNVRDGKSWEALTLEGFAELGKAGFKHPLMDEIEAQFAAPG
jgi:tetratricopeptide (TPR) repeat protein